MPRLAEILSDIPVQGARVDQLRSRCKTVILFSQGRRAKPRARTEGLRGIRIGEADNPGPLHIEVFLGFTKVLCLVDTGADFDAIDADLSHHLRSQTSNPDLPVGETPTDPNSSFRGRRTLPESAVIGFTTDMSKGTQAESDWIVGFHGSEVWGGLNHFLHNHEHLF